MFLWVRDEVRHDLSFSKLDHIYLINGRARLAGGDIGVGNNTPKPMGRALHSEYAEVEEPFRPGNANFSRRNMKLILDFVPNHTSGQHPWFYSPGHRAAAGNATGISGMTAAPGGGPPNNWLSVLGGSGWDWDGYRDQILYIAAVPGKAAMSLKTSF